MAHQLRLWVTDHKVMGSSPSTIKLPLLHLRARPLALIAVGMLYYSWPCAMTPNKLGYVGEEFTVG